MKKGLSLAEVLIVLAIIGMIVVLTVPNTIINAQKQARLTQAKKAYKALAEVYKYTIYDDGDGNIVGDNTPASLVDVKGIDAATIHQIDNLEEVATTMFNENMRAGGVGVNCNSNPPSSYCFRTDDGSVFTFSNFNSGCTYHSNNDIQTNGFLDDPGLAGNNACFTIMVDVNGNAKPNTLITHTLISNKDYSDQYIFYGFKTEIKYLNEHAEIFQNNR